MANILVGIDGSERGERALAWASDYADRRSARLTLLTVADMSNINWTSVGEAELLAAGKKLLESSKASVQEKYPALQVDTLVLSGKVANVVAVAADNFDMVVLGTHHGRSINDVVSGAKGLLVSVSTETPTVIVPLDWKPEAEGKGILVGIGPDASSDAAAEFAATLAMDMKEPLTLTTVKDIPAVMKNQEEFSDEGIPEEADAALTERVKKLMAANPGLEASGVVLDGDSPAKVLAKASEKYRMLVLGTHSRTAFGRALYGSVTHGVLQGIAVPTMIVPES